MMCGLAGFIERRARHCLAESKDMLGRMIGVLALRGPNNIGDWTDIEQGVMLGHRRLSVIDLSSAGFFLLFLFFFCFVFVFFGVFFFFLVLCEELLCSVWAL